MSLETHETSLLVTIPHAARSLGVGIRIVRAAIEAGQVRSVKLGRRTLVPRAEIERLASEGK